MNKAVFLDRDGVINKKIENGYVKNLKEFRILPGVKKALQKLKSKGYLIIIITNQRGVARRILTKKDLRKIHSAMKKKLPEIDDIFFCPHEKNACKCRKPNIGMFLAAQEKWKIDFSQSMLISDSESDLKAGEKIGCHNVLIKTNNNLFYEINKNLV